MKIADDALLGNSECEWVKASYVSNASNAIGKPFNMIFQVKYDYIDNIVLGHTFVTSIQILSASVYTQVFSRWFANEI